MWCFCGNGKLRMVIITSFHFCHANSLCTGIGGHIIHYINICHSSSGVHWQIIFVFGICFIHCVCILLITVSSTAHCWNSSLAPCDITVNKNVIIPTTVNVLLHDLLKCTENCLKLNLSDIEKLHLQFIALVSYAVGQTSPGATYYATLHT